jgi:hypothetical protein
VKIKSVEPFHVKIKSVEPFHVKIKSVDRTHLAHGTVLGRRVTVAIQHAIIEIISSFPTSTRYNNKQFVHSRVSIVPPHKRVVYPNHLGDLHSSKKCVESKLHKCLQKVSQGEGGCTSGAHSLESTVRFVRMVEIAPAPSLT